MGKGRLWRVVGLVAGLAGVCGARAADPDYVFFASTDRAVAANSGVSKVDYGVIDGDRQSGIRPGRDGVPEVRGLYLNPGVPSDVRESDVSPSGVRYPPLRAGDLIPGFGGRVCRVDPLVVPKRGEPSTFAFRTIQDPPAGTALQPGGWAVPVGASDAVFGTIVRRTRPGVTDHYRVWVDAARGPAEGPKAADLRVRYGLAEGPKAAATVRAGDVLWYTGVGLRVANVVPKDPKTRAIGWVEFDSKALRTEEEARVASANAGGRVVAPVEPKQ